MLEAKRQETMVSDFLKRSINALISKQTNIFSAAFFIIITTVFSQVLGIFKYRFLVSIFGASSDLGVFLASFRIPDFLFQILIASALTSVFIPVFSDYISDKKDKEAFDFTSSLITIGVSFFIAVSIIIAIFSYQLSSLIAPGFSRNELVLMSNLTRIILFSQMFFIVGVLITAILQSFQHFFIPGIASSFYNLGIIIGLVIFAPRFGIYGAALGVLLGSFLFCLVQLPVLIKMGFRYSVSFNIMHELKKLFHLMIPRSLTLLMVQVAQTSNVFFASLISARSFVIFDLAQGLFLAPVTLFGQSIAQASFPSLSQKSRDSKEFLYIFLSSFTQILYFTLPISALLIILRIPMVRLFYGASKFDWQATTATGMTLAFFSISLFAQSLIQLLSRSFFALKDTRTPFLITLFSVVTNIVLGYLFIYSYKLPIFYLALAYSVASILSFSLSLFFLNKKIGIPKVSLFAEVVKIIVATIIMGVALYIPIKLLDKLVFDTTRTINLLFLTSIASFLGLSAYVFFTWLLNIKEAYYVIEVVRKFRGWNKILVKVEEPIDGTTSLNP